jgi:hypothetical protein
VISLDETDQYDEINTQPTANNNLLNFCFVLFSNSWRVGDPEKPQVLFGELFDDEQTQQHYEGLAATLKAAKKRGIVTYKSPILLKGAHDKVMVNLVDTSPQQGGSSEPTMTSDTTTTNSNSENDGEKDKRKEAKAKLFAALSEE